MTFNFLWVLFPCTGCVTSSAIQGKGDIGQIDQSNFIDFEDEEDSNDHEIVHDTGWDDTASLEPSEEITTEPSSEVSIEPTGEPANEYTGSLPDGSLPGCLLEMDGVTNSGLYCFEGAWITEQNCNNSYLVYQTGGCSPDNIIAICLDIPADGDYQGVSNGFFYNGAVDTEYICDMVGGSWEYIGE